MRSNDQDVALRTKAQQANAEQRPDSKIEDPLHLLLNLVQHLRIMIYALFRLIFAYSDCRGHIQESKGRSAKVRDMQERVALMNMDRAA